MNVPSISYQWFSFRELSLEELYEILSLRQNVFIVEQNCPYMDIDGLDPKAWHLLGGDAEGNLVAYLRVLAPGVKYQEPSIGRVVTAKNLRGSGIGRELMLCGIQKVQELFPGSSIRLSAQVAAQNFYRELGFESVGEVYSEDGILHIDMIKVT